MTRIVSTDSGVAFLQKDTVTGIAGSVQSQDVVRFSTAPTFPVTVTYEFDAMVALIQEIFDQDAFGPSTQEPVIDVLSARDTALLVKESKILTVDYTATIQAAPGFTKASVVADVKTNIAEFNATQKLGGEAFVGDVDKIV